MSADDGGVDLDQPVDVADRVGVGLGLPQGPPASHPKDKPRAERPLPHIRDSFWSGRSFSSLDGQVK
jgi:hypothetical protein